MLTAQYTSENELFTLLRGWQTGSCGFLLPPSITKEHHNSLSVAPEEIEIHYTVSL